MEYMLIMHAPKGAGWLEIFNWPHRISKSPY